jgi:hypothetical protein
MKRVLGHVMAGLICTVTAGAAVSACAHDDSTIFIYNVIAPMPTGGQCTFTANPTQSFESEGTIDVALTGGYDAVFLVGNQLVAQADPTVPRTETSIVDLQGAIVRITDASGNQIANFTDLAAGSIPPASGGTPGYAAMQVTIINQATVAKYILPQLPFGNLSELRFVTYTKMFGKSLGGQYVESNEFEFPINACRGCLIAFSTADVNLQCNMLNCLGASTTTTTTTSSPCFPGEDQPIDCSLCRNSNPPIPECNPNPDCLATALADAGTD